MDKPVSAEQFRITTREVVSERPEYVYEPPKNPDPEDPNGDMCRYVHGDKPGCVIGHVAHRLGATLAELSALEGQSAGDVVASLFGITGSGGAFAAEIQWRQDCGMPWGEALAHAENYSPTGVIL